MRNQNRERGRSARSSCRLILFAANDRLGLFEHDGGGDLDGEDVLSAWNVIHDVEHDLFKDAAQGSRAGAFFHSQSGEGIQGIRDKLQLHAFHGHELGVLFGQRVFWFGQDGDQLGFVELVQHRHHGQASNELWDEAVGKEVFGFNVLHDRRAIETGEFVVGIDRGAEAHDSIA